MIISSVRLCQLRQDAARQLLQPAAAFSGSKGSPSAPSSATRADRSSKQRKPRTGGSERSTDGSKGTPDPAPASDSSVAAKAKQRLQSGRQRTSQASELGHSRGHPVALKQRQSPKPEPAPQLEQLQQERQRRQQQQQQQAKQQGLQEQQGQKEAAQQDQGQRAGAGRKRWLRRRWRARQKAPDPGQQQADEQPPRSGGSRGASPQAEKSKLPFKQRQQQPGEQTVPQEQQKETDVIEAVHHQQLPVLVPLPQPREQQQLEQLTPRLQGSTAPSQDGMSQADYQRAPGTGLESGASGIDAPTTGLHSRQAAAQQREVGSGAAAAQADIVPKADRQQTRAFIRLRLEQLHQQQEHQRPAPAVGAPGSADVQDEAGTPAEAAGQRAQQQHARQAQVGWAVEAAEMLCSLGMSPEEAAKTLQAAQAYSSRRRQAAPGRSSAGSSAEGGAAAGRAAPASEPGAPPGPVTAAHAESVCRVLADEARIPVGRLRDVLARAPQLLGCTAEDLRKQYEVLAPVWRRPRRLAQAILGFPAMLGPDYPAQLGTGLKMLGSLGLSREQVSSTILRHPQVVQYKRQDVLRRLRSAGLDLDTAPAEVFQFIAENPHLLSREGSQQLRGKLLLLRGWRLPPPLCPLVLARCPPLLKQPEESLQEVADILINYGMTSQQLHQVLLGYPYVLCLQPDLVRLPLKLLADFGVGLERVAEYPRVFGHDPVTYLGPRLAYLRAYNPDKLRYRLVTLLSRSDEEFAKLSGRMAEEYQVFKDAWVRQFEEQVDLPTRSGQRIHTLSQRLWQAEVTDELWL